MIPYSKTVTEVVTAGIDNVVELPAPIRGLLNRLVISQVGGTAAFTARLFTAEAPAGAADDHSDVDAEEGLPAEAFAVTPELAGVSGKYAAYDTRLGYESNEYAQEGRRQSSLWLRLTPAGSGPATYVIGYTVLIPNLN